MKWLTIVAALALGACSGIQGVGDLRSAVPAVDATVAVQPGVGVKCDWSSRPRVVSCHALSPPGKEQGTGDVDASSVVPEPTPVPPGGD